MNDDARHCLECGRLLMTDEGQPTGGEAWGQSVNYHPSDGILFIGLRDFEIGVPLDDGPLPDVDWCDPVCLGRWLLPWVRLSLAAGPPTAKPAWAIYDEEDGHD